MCPTPRFFSHFQTLRAESNFRSVCETSAFLMTASTRGFRLLIIGTSTPQIAEGGGKLNLTGQGIKDAFGFYVDLINNDLMPIQPLLGPEPWVNRSTKCSQLANWLQRPVVHGAISMTGVRKPRTQSLISPRRSAVGKFPAKREDCPSLSTSTVHGVYAKSPDRTRGGNGHSCTRSF